MSKYVEGCYKVKADEALFEEILSMKHRVQVIAGLFQNDMVITHEDLDCVDEQIRQLTMTLEGSVETFLHRAEYLGETYENADATTNN